MADFTEDEVEDGEGKTGALVYSTIADLIASGGFLESRNFTSLAGGSESTQKAAMLLATDKTEAAILPFMVGMPRNFDQSRLFPMAGAYAPNRTLLAADEVPSKFLDAWSLACEKQHAGTLFEPKAGVSTIESEDVDDMETVYRSGASFDPIKNDPEIWPLLRQVAPPL